MSDALTKLRLRLSRESGFTMIEVVVAVAVLTVGILGMAMGFDSSRRLSLVSERHATMAHVAQREIERLEGIAYSHVGMTQAPGPHSTDPANPNYYVIDGSPPSFKWDRTSGSAETVDVPTDGSGQVAPTQTWQEGSLSGQMDDFVTWVQDPRCAPGCPASNDYKRVTVAVTIGGGLQPYPVYLSSEMADPQAMPAGGISNGNGGNPLTNPNTYCQNSQGVKELCTSPIDQGNANTWFPHDCPATSTCTPPTADHALHGTVGLKPAGVCTTSQSQATNPANVTGCPVPDLMDTNPSPGCGSSCGSCDNSSITNPLCNYTQDLCNNSCNPTGGGVINPTCTSSQCPTGSGSGSGSGGGTGSTSDCNNGAFTNLLVNAQSHMWVTSPLTSAMTLNGEGGLSVFTSTLGGASSVVSFCLEIYDVPPSGSAGSLSDLFAWPPVDLGGSGYVAETDPATQSNWPSGASQVSYIFNFRGSNGAVTIPSGHRVGFRIWMKANTNAAINVIYDNPLFPTQLQLNSQ